MTRGLRPQLGIRAARPQWKGKPVIGGNVGGIPLQVIDGQTGFLVDDVKACAEKTLYLLQHPAEARQMGEAAREHVRRHFLSTRDLSDYLRLLNTLRQG